MPPRAVIVDFNGTSSDDAARSARMPCVTVAGDVEDVLAALVRDAGAPAASRWRARR
jgi:hypothetical protein